MLEFATSVASVKRNIDTYWLHAHDHPDLIKDAVKAKQWKGYLHCEGRWRLGPSRFVGYEGMTVTKYLSRKGAKAGGVNGTETEAHLRGWGTAVSIGSAPYHQLLDALTDFLARSDVRVNKAAAFTLFEPEENAERDPLDLEVEALVTLSERLPPAYLAKLQRRLAALAGG